MFQYCWEDYGLERKETLSDTSCSICKNSNWTITFMFNSKL